ncbi:hypothetical protein B0H14DRAFT_2678673 [Mycena olivaceomarginata]|nr:hypothetical protein B0H14DRAFT_2678673 [Mycena olivaceomarginata]
MRNILNHPSSFPPYRDFYSNRPTNTDNGETAAQTPQGGSSTQAPQQPQQSSPQSIQNIPKPPPSTSAGSSKPTNSASPGNPSQTSNLSQAASGSPGFSQSSQRMTTSRKSETTTASSPLANGQSSTTESLTTEIPGGNTQAQGSSGMNPSGRTHRPAQTISIIVPIICIGITLCVLGLYIWRRQQQRRNQARQTLVPTIHATHGPHSDDYERDHAHARLEQQSEKAFLRNPTSTVSVSVPSPSKGTAFRLPDLDVGTGISVTPSEYRDLAGARATILPNPDSDIADWSEQSEDIRGHTDAAIRDRHVLNERELTVAPASALPESRQEVPEAAGLRQQNETLRNQVAHLEMQIQIERELGLAGEPPPRYAQ